ncbi:MAG: anti-anti-sigma factor, partial [Burkholderiaceae bacterium]|nr:anti-anti-sigma factor [Burkholderiaceae bacterium]
LAAVVAVGWSALVGLQGAAPGGQLASASAPSVPKTAPVVAVAEREGAQVMLRDPRLDELMAAHQQFGATSTLQMPAGFLRNATFDRPQR